MPKPAFGLKSIGIKEITCDTKRSAEGLPPPLNQFSPNEVLDGFPDSGIALYPIERGDTSAFIMSQSKSCGVKHDLVVAIGVVSSL